MVQKDIDNVIESMPCVLEDEVKFVLTGTFVLSLFGLMDEYNDVDVLVVNAPGAFWPMLLDKYRDDIATNTSIGYNCIKINRNGITYNFIQDDSYIIERDSTNLWLDSHCLYVDSIPHALMAKWGLGRDKDKKHFSTINERLNALLSISNTPNHKCCTTYKLIWKYAEKVINFAKTIKI